MSTVTMPAMVYVFAARSGIYMGCWSAEDVADLDLLAGVQGVETIRGPSQVSSRCGKVRLTYEAISATFGKARRENCPWSVFYDGEAVRHFKTQAEALGYIVAKWPDETPPAMVDEEGKLW